MSFSLLCQCARYVLTLVYFIPGFLLLTILSFMIFLILLHIRSLTNDSFVYIYCCNGVYALMLFLVQPMSYSASLILCIQGPLHAGLVDAIRPYLPALRNSPYGKRILSRTNIKKWWVRIAWWTHGGLGGYCSVHFNPSEPCSGCALDPLSVGLLHYTRFIMWWNHKISFYK